jgi:hypothetical protein
VKPLSLRQALRFAWPAFTKHFFLFAAILLTFCGAWVALEVVVIKGQQSGIVLWAAAHLAFLLFFAGLEAGLLHVGLAAYEGVEPTFAEAFSRLALGPRFLAGQLLYLVMVAAGLVLLVVPGLYLGARYALFGFSLVSGEPGLARSFQRSAALRAGRTGSLLAILVGLLVFNVLGASLLGVGLFVTLPLSVLVMAAVYRQLAGD